MQQQIDVEQYIKKIFNKYNKVTKKSHFVKQEYLKNWSRDNNSVLTSLNGSPYKLESTTNICHERYMYKMEMLTDNEVMQLKYFYAKSPEIVRKINDDFINDWQLCCKLMKLIENDKNKEMLKKMLIQTGEDLQTNLESAYTDKIKKCILSCDESFLLDDDEKLNFCLFLFSQYLRTQKKKQAIMKNYEEADEERKIRFPLDPTRMWKLLIIIMTNMASYTMLLKLNVHIEFIKSTNNLLITGDQPIVNIIGDDSEEKFYFPISPSVGLIFPCSENKVITDNQSLIDEVNDLIKKSSVRYVIKY